MNAQGSNQHIQFLRQGYMKDGVGYIPLMNDKWALCDAHWFTYLAQFNWRATAHSGKRWYAIRSFRSDDGRWTTQKMHRVVMRVTDPTIEVDHKDRDATLDNREANLRIATVGQNQHNVGLRKDNTSGFKGVTRQQDKWRATIYINNRRVYLGLFDSAVAAAAVWNFAAKRLHGDFAVLNELSQAVS